MIFNFNAIKKLDIEITWEFALKYDESHWRQRIDYCKLRITEDYDYIANNKNFQTRLNNLFIDFCVFAHYYESSNFRKQKDFKHSFTKLKYLDDFLSNYSEKRFTKGLKNVLFAKICQFYFQNRIILGFDLNSDYSGFTNSHDQTKLGYNYFSKTLLYSNTTNDLNSWLYVFSSATKTEIDARFLEEIVVKFDLFLNVSDGSFKEENVIIGTNDKSKNDKSRLVTLVKTPLTNETLDYYLFLKKSYCTGYCKFPPLVLENKNYQGCGHWVKGALVVSSDLPFFSSLLINNNHKYGFQEKSSSGMFYKGTPDFVLSDTSKLFYENVKKDMETPYVLNKVRFIEEANIFAKQVFSKIEIDLEKITFDEIKTLIAKGFLPNDESRALVNNLYILYHIKSLLTNFNHGDTIYMTLFNDFRGRKYTQGLISYTSFPIARHCIYDGFYENKKLNPKLLGVGCEKLYDNVLEIEKASLATRTFVLLKSLIPSLQSLLLKSHSSAVSDFFLKYDHESRLSLEFRQASLVNIIISIGLVFKGELLKFPEYSDKPYQFSMQKCFELGVHHYLYFVKRKSWATSDADDLLLLRTFESIITPGSDWRKKTTIPYDFSASGHQIRYTQMIFSKDANYDNINVGGETTGVDIYSLIIFLFKREVSFIRTNGRAENFMNEDLVHDLLIFLKKETNSELVDKILNILNRKNLKKSLMTGEYNATLPTFIQYFKESIDEKDEWIRKENWKNVEHFLKILYKFSTSLENLPEFASEKKIDFFYNLFKQNQSQKTSWDGFTLCISVFDEAPTDSRVYFSINSDKLEELKVLAKKWGWVEIDDNRENKSTSRETSRVRSRHKSKIYENHANERLTLRAFTPNFVHSIDGSVVRLVVRFNHPVRGLKTVHDEYWVPYLEAMIFKDIVNSAIKVNTYPIKYNLAPTSINDLELINEKIKPLFNFFVIM